jgi:hypothetical protein
MSKKIKILRNFFFFDIASIRGDHFRFDSVLFFIKKSNKTGFFKKINRNRFKPTGFGSVILEQKQVFFRFGLVFSVWLGFGLVRFGFLGFKLIKPKPNRTGRFFINFYRFFFHGYVFFIIFFPV